MRSPNAKDRAECNPLVSVRPTMYSTTVLKYLDDACVLFSRTFFITGSLLGKLWSSAGAAKCPRLTSHRVTAADVDRLACRAILPIGTLTLH